MKRNQLKNAFDAWLSEVENKSTNRTFCAIEDESWDDGNKYKLIGFNLDKARSEELIKEFGKAHDYGRLCMNVILDLSKKADKKYFDSLDLKFGEWRILRKYNS